MLIIPVVSPDILLLSCQSSVGCYSKTSQKQSNVISPLTSLGKILFYPRADYRAIPSRLAAKTTR